MFSNNTPDAAAKALTTLMHALIDIECTAELAQRETGHLLILNVSAIFLPALWMRLKIFLLLIVKMGGVMRDDRFNSLKQEFSGTPDDAVDALSSISEIMRVAFFLICTDEHRDTGLNILDIAANYADFVTEAALRKTTDGN